MILARIFILSIGVVLFSCTPNDKLKEQIKAAIKEDPSIITQAIKDHPVAFIEAMQEAAQLAQGEMARKREEDKKKEMEGFYDNPLTPKIRKDESIRGNKKAPILIVKYSDFECPYCSKGYQTVQALRKKYGKNVQYMYKHLPLSFHQNATGAASYYEAIRIQDEGKAWKFHDELLENTQAVSKGENYFKSLAKKLGLNMRKLAKDVKSEAVKQRIQEDQDEAQSFGIQGTPGFVINGIPVKGAYPLSHFEQIIDELQKRKKINLN